ncbi:hypothetical protein APA_4340 [Pseudanabaena sp. lw0831]|uniref:hypothetical protein n=1 Tax=Pseudanabaena sp. lw0831 TaxID=1357935 RepID=UPI001A20BC18|nr:hypothetical protein [Pseudanabaena sp. lw0831]GBO52035.1 hypothetical protein APA_4340 [Pseudanabaena sp. lw0831]
MLIAILTDEIAANFEICLAFINASGDAHKFYLDRLTKVCFCSDCDREKFQVNQNCDRLTNLY